MSETSDTPTDTASVTILYSAAKQYVLLRRLSGPLDDDLIIS
jgi:hypothetical protein